MPESAGCTGDPARSADVTGPVVTGYSRFLSLHFCEETTLVKVIKHSLVSSEGVIRKLLGSDLRLRIR